MNRIEKLRTYLNQVILSQEDSMVQCFAYSHLYGVAQACALIAMKRKQNVELAIMAGMLHDIYTVKTQLSENHAELGAVIARDILSELSLATSKESETICDAIKNHSAKADVHPAFTEVLIDADVMQHYFYNPIIPVVEHEQFRLHRLKEEFDF